MAEEDAAERATQEIKALLRRLDPKDSSHKDRIRRLNKFRNYVTGESSAGTPEFYDDDIPLLLLGSAAPAALLASSDLLDDIDYGGGDSSEIYGLLQACGYAECGTRSHAQAIGTARHVPPQVSGH